MRSFKATHVGTYLPNLGRFSFRELHCRAGKENLSIEEERLIADYYGTGFTSGPHPMAYQRESLQKRGIRSAAELQNIPHGREVTTAGCVIVRQRPGTAKGIIFMTLEDETGTSRVSISPDFYDDNRMTVLKKKFVLVTGVTQNQEKVVHLKARCIQPLYISAAETSSHDFH